MAAEGTGPLLHARVGMMRAINAGKAQSGDRPATQERKGS
jgi:hypothetical protein